MKEWTLGPRHERPDTSSGVGQTAAPQRAFCAHCGAESAGAGARFCSGCGLPLPSREAAPAESVGSSEAPETPKLNRVVRVKEFNSLNAYQNWLHAAGTGVQIINMSTTKRWGFWTGFLGGAKTYTVTFEELLPDSGPAPSSLRFRDWLPALLFVIFLIVGWLLSLYETKPSEGISGVPSDQSSESSIVNVDLTCAYQDRPDYGVCIWVHAVLRNNTDEQLKLVGPELDF